MTRSLGSECRPPTITRNAHARRSAARVQGGPKDPLGDLIRRIAALFESASLEPEIQATFSDGPAILQSTSAVERAIRKYPHLAPLERVHLPHDLPPAGDARRQALGAHGPLKPTLVETFKPRGYDCRGESGVFTLRRRTAANHVVDIELDVGTWSRSVTFVFSVRGPAFNATVFPPVTARDASRQYPIGDTANWQQIVANMAAIVDELKRTFVREIEAAVDPAPEWFEPGR